MRIILHGDVNVEGMAKAALEANAFKLSHDNDDLETDKLKYLGLRLNGVYYSIRFNKVSISVWLS